MYHDHICQEAHANCHAMNEREVDAAQGCGVRKKTIIIEGDIVYKDRLQKVEQGTAGEIERGCEQIKTTVSQEYASLEAPSICSEVSACIWTT